MVPPLWISLAGAAQLSILIASALVPFQLDWKRELAPLSRLHRQMYWTYGGYVVLAIMALGLTCLIAPAELASGTPLARCVCAYGALFWGIRSALQLVFDVRGHLHQWWIRVGYHLLSTLFTLLAALFFWMVVS